MTALSLPRPNLSVVPALLRRAPGLLRGVPARLRRAPQLLRHAPAASVLATGVGLYLFAGLTLAGGGGETAVVGGAPGQAAQAAAAPPPPESAPGVLLQISAAEAMLRNAAIPFSVGPNPAARAFTLPPDEVAKMRSVDCLTAAIYYEAATEPVDGQRAVAQVVLNRVRHPNYPNTVCGVVFQGHQRTTGCQFSFTCDGSLRRTPMASLWSRARKLAEEALAGYVHAPVGWATHYHANYVMPYWAPTLAKVATIGAHIFYRWDGGWGRPGAFTSRYAGAEPDIRWRGGFGQPDQAQLTAAAATEAAARDAAAAAAAEEAKKNEPQHSVDSFQRAVLRRYEPVNRENATRIIQNRMGSEPVSNSNRWALTGGQSNNQQPLGRREDAPAPPVVLEGVRRRPGAATPAPPATPEGTQAQ